jgi:hypothetical protein
LTAYPPFLARSLVDRARNTSIVVEQQGPLGKMLVEPGPLVMKKDHGLGVPEADAVRDGVADRRKPPSLNSVAAS